MKYIRNLSDYFLALAMGPDVSDSSFLRLRDKVDEVMEEKRVEQQEVKNLGETNVS